MSHDTDSRLADRDYHLKRANAAQAMAAASRDGALGERIRRWPPNI